MDKTPIYAPLTVVPNKQSWCMGLILSLICVLALIAILILPIAVPWRLLIAIGAITSWWQEMRLHVWRNSLKAIVKAVWDFQGDWQIYLASGIEKSASLTGDSLATPILVVLNFRLGRWGRHSLILSNDNCDPETLRKLRARLHLEYVRDLATKTPPLGKGAA